MLYLQATKNVRVKLGLGKLEFAEAEHTESALGNWLVNVVPVADRQAFLFMSTRSLLTFPMLIGRKATTAEDVPAFLAHGVGMLLQSIHTPKAAAAALLDDFKVVALCKAVDRSLLAQHSAIASDYLFLADDAGQEVDLSSIIHEVNSTPREKLGWSTSFEVAEQLLSRSGEA